MENNRTLQHQAAEHRYVFDLGDSLATIEYELEGDICRLTHTFVPANHQGEGIAAALTEAVLTEMKARGLRIIPECSYIVAYVKRHPEWEAIVAHKE